MLKLRDGKTGNLLLEKETNKSSDIDKMTEGEEGVRGVTVYRRRKWTGQAEFESRTKMFAFHFVVTFLTQTKLN